MNKKTVYEYEFSEEEIKKALKLPKDLKLISVWTKVNFGRDDTIKVSMEGD